MRYFFTLIIFFTWGHLAYSQLPSITGVANGNTSGCAPLTITFNVNDVSGNEPGTTYSFDFGDGTPPLSFNQSNVPPTVSHTYQAISCGQTFNAQQNCFGVRFTATNSSGPKIWTYAPVRISKKPNASFTQSTNRICAGGTIDFKNISDPGVTYSGNNCNKNPPFYWAITGPSAGSPIAGSSGSNNGIPGDFNAWTPGTTDLSLQFDTPGSYQMKLTIANSCGLDDTTLTFCVVAKPQPQFTLNPTSGCIPPNLTVAATNGTSVISNPCFTTSYTYNWSVQPTSGWSFQAPGNAGSFNSGFSFNTVGTYNVKLSASVNSLPGCSSEVVLPITVSQAPVVNAGPDQSICVGGGSIQLAGTPSGGTWSGTGVNPGGTFNAPAAGSYTLTYSLTQNGCTGTDQVVISVINPTTANAGTDQALCQNSAAINLVGTPGNGTWSGSPLVTAGGLFTPSAAGTYTLTYTIGSGTCASSDQVLVTVHDLPIVGVNNLTLCAGTSGTLTATGSGGLPPYSYSWFPGTGLSSTTGASVTASPSVSGQYSVTATDARGCKATGNVQVTVNPLPLVNAGNDISICNNSGPYNLSGATPAGGSWSGSGVSTGGVFSAPGLGNYTLTYSVVQNGCTGTDQLIISVIAPTPANAGADQAICLNAPPMNLAGSPTGGTWSGSALVTPAGVFTPSAAGSYTLTYTFGSGTCLVSDQMLITVHDLPLVTVNSPAICEGTGGTLTAGASGGSGPYTYSWSPSAGLSAVSGPTVQANPAISTQYTVTATDSRGCSGAGTSQVTVNTIPQANAGNDISICNNSGPYTLMGASPAGGSWSGTGVTPGGIFTAPGVGTYSLSYSVTQNNCTGTDQITLSVIDPTPANAGADLSICLNSPAVVLNGTPAGGTWSGSALVSPDGTFTPSSTGTHTLTYQFGSGTCQVSDQLTIAVNALPSVAVNDPTMCAGQSSTITAQGSGGSAPYEYTWAPDTDLSAPTGAQVTATPTTSTQYTVTVSDLNGCLGTDISQLTVHPLPMVDAGSDLQVCNTPVATPLTGAVPAGGTWSGSGVNNGSFTPVAEGTVALTYTYTDANQCVNSDTILVTVSSPQTVHAGNDTSICVLYPAFIITGQSPAGGIWSGDPQITPDGEIKALTPGSYTLHYTVGSGTCAVSDQRNLTIQALPVVFAGPDTAVCANTAIFSFSSQAPVSGGTWNWAGAGVTDSVSGMYDASIAGLGTHTIQYKFQDGSTGCSSSDSLVVLVHAPTPIDLEPDLSVCLTPYSTLIDASPTGGSWSWTDQGFNADLNSPADTVWFIPPGTGTYEAYYTFTNQHNCISKDTISIQVTEPQDADAGPDTAICYNPEITIQLSGTPPGGTWDEVFNPDWLQADGSFSPNQADTSLAIYTFGQGSCQTWDTTRIVIYPLPFVDAGIDTFRCLDDPCFKLIPITPSGGIWSGTGISGADGTFCSSASGAGNQEIYYQIDTSYVYLGLHATCANRDTLNLLVVPMPIPGLSIDSVICVGTEYTLGNLSSGPSASFEWTVVRQGTGETIFTSTLPAPVLKINQTGNYTLHLSSISPYGCSVSTSTDFLVVEPPRPLFSISDDLGCGPYQGGISNQSSGYGLSYSWDLGPGFPLSNLEVPALPVYPSPVLADSLYFVELSLSNLCGTRTYKDSVTVRPEPVASIGTDYSQGCSPMEVLLQNLSYGSPSAFAWDFGNGSSSNDSLPSGIMLETQNIPGTYLIRLTVSNSCGTSIDSTEVTVYPNTFSLGQLLPDTACAPYNFDFAATVSGQTYYLWDFGDGTGAIGDSVSHQFPNPGNYLVRLTISNYCFTDTVQGTMVLLEGPDLNFALSAGMICEDSDVSISNNSGTNSTGFGWIIPNDSLAGYTAMITRTFETSGKFNIGLSGSNIQTGCRDTLYKILEVIPHPAILVSASPDTGCAPLWVQFENTTENANAFEWQFNNGTASFLREPYIQISQTGNFRAKLIAHNYQSNQFDCPDSTEVSVWVNPSPFSYFKLLSEEACGPPASAEPVNQSAGANFYEWSWQNQLSIEFAPSLTFTDTGSFNVSLRVGNEFQCYDTSYGKFRVHGQPKIAFNLLTEEGCAPLQVHFENLTQYGDSVHWAFGNGFYSNDWNAEHVFEDSGIYPVEIYVSSGNGFCSDDTIITQAIRVFPVAHAEFTVDPQPISQSSPTINLMNLSSGYNSLRFFIDSKFFGAELPSRYIFENPDSGNMELVLIANNEFNCPDTAKVNLYIQSAPSYYLPDSFSPNDDGINDRYKIIFDRAPSFYIMRIYNRWGELLYHSNDFNQGWDGSYRGNPVETGVYILKFSAIFEGTIKTGELYKNITVIH